MEPLLTTLIPSLLERISSETIDKKERKVALITLKKVFLIECRVNLKILDVAKNDRLEDKEVNKLLTNLDSQAAKAIFSYVDYSIVQSIYNKIIKTKDDEKGIENDISLVSIIGKIELLKILGKDLDGLSEKKVVKIKLRIKNLRKQLLEIVNKLNEEISKKKS